MATAFMGAASPCAGATPLGAWEAAREVAALPPDTLDAYPDGATRTLVFRAREAREELREGLDSYEARMWERLYVGLDATRFRRERGLLDRERAGWVRWERDGRRIIRWEGAREDVPVAGPEEGRRRGAALQRSLAGSGLPAPLQYRPGDDRIVFGSTWALHPLSDTAAHHYRFALGDTLRLRLSSPPREIQLVELRVTPRRSDFRLLAGSLWFDHETGELVRASYRPARPFDLAVDGGEDGEGAPRLLRSIQAEIQYVTVDYGLYDLDWWLPRRFVFEGEVRLGAVVRIPAVFEWTLDEFAVNGADAVSPVDGVPHGWEHRVRREGVAGEDSVKVIVFVPPGDSLQASPRVGDAVAGREPLSLGRDEARETLARVGALRRAYGLPRPQLAWGLQDELLRYNRVEGLGAGMRVTVPVSGRSRLWVEPRLATGEPLWSGEVGAAQEGAGRRLSGTVYRRTAHTEDGPDPHRLAAGLSALVLGSDPADYYRAEGGEVRAEWERRWGRGWGEIYHERHAPLSRTTTFHLFNPAGGGRFRENFQAEAGNWTGVRTGFRWQSGVDPARARIYGRVGGEAASGSGDYVRATGRLGVASPQGGAVSGALEVAVGGVAGSPPRQRLFAPGGPETFRGFRPGLSREETFWVARAEVGRGITAARTLIFMDAGRVTPAAAFFRAPDRISVGAGLSFLDGLARVDVAWPIRGGDGSRVHLYLDGLL